MNKPVSSRTVRTQLSLNNLFSVILILALLGAINYFSYRYYKRIDFSRNQFYTLSDKTINILKSLKEPVHITTYLINSQLTGQIDSLLTEYEAYGGKNIKIDRVDPAVQVDLGERLARQYGLDTQENLVIFEYKDQHKYLDESQLADYDESPAAMGQPPILKDFKGEQQFTATIQALVEGKPSKIYFLTGHGEREITGSTAGSISSLVTRIQRDNNSTEVLNLAATNAVPDDCDLLIICGPTSPLTPPEIEAVSDYLDKRGKIILLQDPQETSGLETVLEKYGLELQPDVVIALGVLKGTTTEVLTGKAFGSTYADHPVVNPLRNNNLEMPNARSIATVKDPANPNVPKVTLLVKTVPDFWGETNFKDPKPTYDPVSDFPGPLALAAVYDGGEVPGEGVKVTGARLLVVGSSSFLTNQDLDGVGLDFILNSINWMLKKDHAIGIEPKLPQEFGLEVSPLQMSTIAVLSLGFLPLLALVTGLIVWFSRRK